MQKKLFVPMEVVVFVIHAMFKYMPYDLRSKITKLGLEFKSGLITSV